MTEPSHTPRVIRWLLTLLTRLFFREVEVSGLEHVPATGGGIVVSWHPNGLVDPCLVLTRLPRTVVFGARHGLFRWPGLGLLLRRTGCVPIYRAQDAAPGADAPARRHANAESLDALARRVAAGSFAALFPEGLSHDEPGLVELKTGVGRLYYRARQLMPAGAPTPVILPVGLHYDEKHLFRSRAHVCFHAPIELPRELDVTPDVGESDLVTRDRARRLTDEIERVLCDVVHATEDWDTHGVLHRGRKLVRAERAARAGADPGAVRIDERSAGFARVRTAYYACLESDPERAKGMVERVRRYDDALRAIGLEDHELDRAPSLAVTPRLALIVLFQLVLVFFLLPPILLVGYVVNGPTAVALGVVARLASTLWKDVATVKMVGGAILFPLTWIAAAVAAGLGHAILHAHVPIMPDQPIQAALLTAFLAIVGAAAALRYGRFARETLQALRVRITRSRHRRAVVRLRVERRAIFDELMAMAGGLELPGEVLPDGRVRAG